MPTTENDATQTPATINKGYKPTPGSVLAMDGYQPINSVSTSNPPKGGSGVPNVAPAQPAQQNSSHQK
jgi:hypothetical protein